MRCWRAPRRAASIFGDGAGIPARDGGRRRAHCPNDIAAAVNDLMAAHGKMPIASDMGDCLFTAMDIDHTALVAPATTPPWAMACRPGWGCRRPPGNDR